jgi:hypothetical protein
MGVWGAGKQVDHYRMVAPKDLGFKSFFLNSFVANVETVGFSAKSQIRHCTKLVAGGTTDETRRR